MNDKKTSLAQKKANKKWKEKNKEKQHLYILRSQAKRFIKEFADEKDLNELQNLINNRKK